MLIFHEHLYSSDSFRQGHGENMIRLIRLVCIVSVTLLLLSAAGTPFDPDDDGVDEISLSTCTSSYVSLDKMMETELVLVFRATPLSVPEYAVRPCQILPCSSEVPSLNLIPRGPPACCYQI